TGQLPQPRRCGAARPHHCIGVAFPQQLPAGDQSICARVPITAVHTQGAARRLVRVGAAIADDGGKQRANGSRGRAGHHRLCSPAHVAGLRAARALADSVLRAYPPPKAPEPLLLATLAALTGHAELAAAYGREPPAATEWIVPAPLAQTALPLVLLASLGGPADRLGTLEQQVDSAIDNALAPPLPGLDPWFGRWPCERTSPSGWGTMPSPRGGRRLSRLSGPMLIRSCSPWSAACGAGLGERARWALYLREEEVTMKRQSVQALVLASSLVAGAIACETTLSGGAATPTIGRPECPSDSFAISVVDSVRTLRGVVTHPRTITTIPLAGPISNVPEFHDCQELIKDNGYLSLYAIFASFRLDLLA